LKHINDTSPKGGTEGQILLNYIIIVGDKTHVSPGFLPVEPWLIVGYLYVESNIIPYTIVLHHLLIYSFGHLGQVSVTPMLSRATVWNQLSRDVPGHRF